MAFPLSFGPKKAGDLIKHEEWNEMREEIDKRVKIAGDTMTGPLTINTPHAIDFGTSAPTRQMLNLWGSEYGIGIQGATQYYRTGGNYAWYRGGAHDGNPLNPGGGIQLMALNSAGDLLLTGRTNPNGADVGKCRALVDGGNLLVLNFENDYSSGVQIGGSIPGTAAGKKSSLRVTGALSFGEASVDNPMSIDRSTNELRVSMGFTNPAPYEFKVGHHFFFGGLGGFFVGFDSKFRVSSTGDVFAERSINGTGADYAELFESENGKPILVGTSVMLTTEGKVRPAQKGEVPFGVISAQPGVIGNSPMAWPHQYVRDDFGAIVMEEVEQDVMRQVKKTITDIDPTTGEKQARKVDVLDENGQPVYEPTGAKQKVTVPKTNPNFDPSKTYIPRNERDEWQKVGMIGQLRLRKGQPTAPSWTKIKDISERMSCVLSTGGTGK